MSLHVTVDMTEIDPGDSPSSGREGNIFIDKQVQAHSNCSFWNDILQFLLLNWSTH